MNSSMQKNRQAGVALITALLVVTLATTLAVAMSSRQQVDIRRTENNLRFDQGMLYAQGGEKWAQSILQKDIESDLKDSRKVDSLDEDWARELPPTPLEDGQISGNISDLQGRFNLNNLLQTGSQNKAEREASELQLAMFQRLLRALELDEKIAIALLDWIDPDGETRFPDGAEDGEYLDQDPPYRPANLPLADVSELRLVKGVNAEAYYALLPHVCVLPEFTAININTASKEVLMSLADEISDTIADNLVAERSTSPAETRDDFIKRVDEQLAGKEGMGEKLKNIIEVSSHYFQSHATVHTGRTRILMHSLIYRNENRTQVLNRTPGSL